MFANFKDIVKKESIEKIPTEIINAYNSKIPNGIGLKYVDNNDGKCILIPDKPKEKMDMTITMPPSNLVDKIPDDIKTQKDLLDYMYRTQKTLYYEIDENSVDSMPYMTINGFKVNLDEITKDPFSCNQKKFLGFYLKPQKFPDVPPLEFKTEEHIITLQMKRIPDERKNTVVLCSEEERPINIRITLLNDEIKMKINYDCKKCKTVSELLTIFDIAKSLNSGTCRISYFEETVQIPIDNCVNENTISFWNNIKHLEDLFQIKFNPNVDIYERDMISLKKLFIGLIENQPFSDTISDNDSIGLSLSDIDKNLYENIGNQIEFLYVQQKDWDILGQKFTTYNLCCIFNAVLSSISEEKNDSLKSYFAHLAPIKGEKMYLSMYIFNSEDELIEFQKQFDSNIEMQNYLKKAKQISV